MAHTKRTKQKISKAIKKIMTPEARANIGKANMDQKLYIFIHKDGTILSSTRVDLYYKFELNKDGLSKLIAGKIQSHGGWRLHKNPTIKR